MKSHSNYGNITHDHHHHHHQMKLNTMKAGKLTTIERNNSLALNSIHTFDTDDSASLENHTTDLSFVTEINTSIISDTNTSLLHDVNQLKSDSHQGHKRSSDTRTDNSISGSFTDGRQIITPQKDRGQHRDKHVGSESSKKRGHRRGNNFYGPRKNNTKAEKGTFVPRKLDRIPSDADNHTGGGDVRSISETASFRGEILSNDDKIQHHQALQRYDEELRSLRKAGYSDDHPEVADALNRIRALESIAETMKISENLHASAQEMETRGEHGQAILNCRKALDVKLRIFRDMPHPSIAMTLHKIGVVLWKTGAYDEAFQYLSKSLDVYRNCQGSNDTEIAETLHSIGHVYLSMGQFASALSYFKEALKLRTTTYDKDHPEVARSLISMGMVFDERGKHSKAMKHYREGLRIQKAHYGNDHVDVAATLNGIGVAHEKWGEYDLAMEAYTEALWIYRSSLGNDHVDVAVTLNNTGQIHRYWGEYTEAMKAYQEALRIMKTVLGENHRNVATTVHNIALVYASTNEYDKAIKLFREVLKAQRAALGDEHVDIAVTLESFGDVYEKKQKFEKAVRLYTKALRVRRLALGKHHLFVGITLDRLATFYSEKMQDDEEALRRSSEALEVYKANNVRNDHPYITSIVNRMADMKHALNQ